MNFIKDNPRRAKYDISRNVEKILTNFKKIPSKMIREVY